MWKALLSPGASSAFLAARAPRALPQFQLTYALSCSLHPLPSRHLRCFHTPSTLHTTLTNPSVSTPLPPSPAPTAATASLPPPASPLVELKKAPLQIRIRQRLREGRSRWRNYLLLSLAGVASYSVFSLTTDLVMFMDSIRHAETLEVAFVSGAIVLASSLTFFSLARRAIPTPLAPPYRVLLGRLRKDPRVREALGQHLRFGPTSTTPALSSPPPPPSNPFASATSPVVVGGSITASGFRLVTRLPGGLRWSAEPGVVYWGWERYWKARRLQFVVTVEGERGHAVVLAQVDHKVDDRKNIQWLSVERIVHPHSEPLGDAAPLASVSHPPRIVLESNGREWSQQ